MLFNLGVCVSFLKAYSDLDEGARRTEGRPVASRQRMVWSSGFHQLLFGLQVRSEHIKSYKIIYILILTLAFFPMSVYDANFLVAKSCTVKAHGFTYGRGLVAACCHGVLISRSLIRKRWRESSFPPVGGPYTLTPCCSRVF